MLGSTKELWQVDDLTVDVGSQSVVRAGVPVTLPLLSFKFLLTLIRASPNVLSIDALIAGFAPSLRLSWTGSYSTLPIYDEQRWRAELGIAKAF